ncbi:Retrovirus-related Pol polyprotein from transposon RE2 [Sesamum angolense]|uniref:Retrovirus-related Pol polyprotein from transposon RE2 n=1 Tax=Sesamum angolense TaxID=2727404 RepID=A0AAE1W4V6_9LAMI|nr:Retrovirus-related Pol polyprotein from transposon RE2 [Sesamum angolense]
MLRLVNLSGRIFLAKFLSGLDNNLKIVRGHLLAGDSVPTLSNALSRVLRVATGSSDSSSSSGTTTESSAMGVRGRGHSSSQGHGGRDRASNTSTNSRYCTHCGRTNHVVDKCWIKHGKPEWANTVTSSGEPAALEPSPNPSESVTLSREEYEQLLHRPVANSATPTTSSSPGAFVVSHAKSWMLDSGATTHLTVTFFPSYCVFQDLQTRRTIGGGHERGGLYFLNTSPPIDARALSASVSPLQWHCRLGHSSLPTLQKVLPIKSSRLACESCELGKHHRASFPPRVDKRSSSPFTLVHSDIEKGYRCYDPQRRRSFTSTDVTFFESTPYYSPNSSPTIILTSVPLPVPTLTTPAHTKTPTRPLQVYSCRNRSTNTMLTALPGLPPTAAPGNLPATPADDLPIALRKGKRSCTAHPLAHSLSFQHLSPNYRAFSVSLSSVSIPNTYHEALWHPVWKMAMDDEMSALISRGTWKLVEVPPDTDVVACRWVFTLKFRADGTLERYKARLVTKGFTQTYGVDYFETFSHVARLNSIRVLFSLAVNLDWPMYQMDIKNAFLYGDLNETVYMEQPPGYIAQGEKQHHSVFVQTTTSGMVVLAVYVDDILITGSDIVGIEEAKTYLQKHFLTKDLGVFFGIEIAHSKHGISLSHRKYACDLLQEAGLLGTKPVDTPMDSITDFWNDDGNYLEDKTKYRRLVGKLIYLTVTRPDISFAVGLVSQFMDKPRSVHWEAALRILKYIKASPDDRKSTSGYCTYVGGNLVTWRSKKQTTVARSSAEAEYRVMAHTTSEILWLKNLLKELGFMYDDPVPMHCDNQAAIHIASNPIVHERTKHVEVDCHFVREAVMSQKICTPFTPSSEQRADIFTKALGGKQFDVLCNKLGIIDIFAPT